jgi:hypothetical protein
MFKCNNFCHYFIKLRNLTFVLSTILFSHLFILVNQIRFNRFFLIMRVNDFKLT